ncbi:MAG: hypothetical protein OXC31_18150 [Spirochaetaceae bacterium]|nr:hypothetical protein [Spirochaetaceae bacterium]
MYQFSHELCHVLTNFDRHKGHRHRWFDESLCELASLFVLHRLAELWKESPPEAIPDAAGFAFNHQTYAERISASYPRPSRDEFSEWFAGVLPKLEADPYARELCGTIAVGLRGAFQADPTLWQDCGHLNHWDPNADPAFRDYLDSWGSCLRERDIEPRAVGLVRKLLQIR